eukprot:gnl/Hemi2/5172_TR1802_c0_g4_i1.p1 gnl/Hemi2/5172_TR1802_c0_g4~~gnl/Hemi2/5172_TR1802_c0_g4_i1.p1  ORF type:complete len:381 (+),score=115.17 gnl/Hemi2/5172_TR1802_c0_g4_i1:1423-2565(+)
MSLLETDTSSTIVTASAAVKTYDQTRIMVTGFTASTLSMAEVLVTNVSTATFTLSATVYPPIMAVGGTTNITVSVYNNGPDAASISTINYVPLGTFAAGTMGGVSATCTPAAAGVYESYTCVHGLVAPGTTISYTFSSLLTATALGTYDDYTTVVSDVSWNYLTSSHQLDTPISVQTLAANTITIPADFITNAGVNCYYNQTNFQQSFQYYMTLFGESGEPQGFQEMWIKVPLWKSLHGYNVTAATYHYQFGYIGYGNTFNVYNGVNNWAASTVTCTNEPSSTSLVVNATQTHTGGGTWGQVDVLRMIGAQYPVTNELDMIFRGLSTTPITYIISADCEVVADRPYLTITTNGAATCSPACTAPQMCFQITGTTFGTCLS